VGWLVGTRDGLFGQGGDPWLEGREITAVTPAADGWWALADGRDVVRLEGGEVQTVASVDEELGRCLLPTDGGVLIGTANARLVLAGAGSVEMLTSFDAAPGRERWYTPWGGPPDTRSLSAGSEGALFANVHVGGILRSDDPHGTWQPTIDIDADVHQVLADPGRADHVVAATALGLAESLDAGTTWRFIDEGLHAGYARAVASDGEALFMSASIGPRGGRAALYRRAPGEAGFAKCTGGLPEWFGQNIDSHQLAAAGGLVVFGADGGRMFVSADGGESWHEASITYPEITCVAIAPGPEASLNELRAP
jgi:hypothetical protein